MESAAALEQVAAALAQVTAALPAHEDRPGQVRMAELVAEAIGSGRHLVVQAGTGTGKTLAYLVPAITSASTVVVATATKALQDQLATKDLPFLADQLDVDFDWAVLKGRSNYVCLQRLRELVPREARHGWTVETSVREGTAYREILRVASENKTDLIVMGVQGRGAIDLMMFGSNTVRVSRAATCPVLIVRK